MTTPATPAEQLKNGTNELATIDRILRLQILNSERDVLDACRPRLRTLVDTLKNAIDGKGDTTAPVTTFTTWKNSVGGTAAWDSYKEIKTKYPDTAVSRPVAAAAGPVVWSATCTTVWNDMDTRFKAWRDGTATNRGHWWQGPANGGANGAVKVPDDVVEELRKRIRDRPGNIVATAWWRFSDSDSGGLSFHRTSGGVDFIYHLTL